MDVQKAFDEKNARFQDLTKQIMEINKKIGALQEEGRALHQEALRVAGALEALGQLKAEADADAEKTKASLILPDKSLVAPDGKTVIAEAPRNTTMAGPAEGSVAAAPKTDGPAHNEDGSLKNPPVALEVK